jgi:hypothetical protein
MTSHKQRLAERSPRRSHEHEREELPGESAHHDPIAANGIMKLQRTIGNQAVLRLMRESTPQPLQRKPKTEMNVKPPEVKPVASNEKSAAEMAQDIMGTQLAILEGWATALDNFDKVMTSDADAAGKANFQKVLYDYLEDKVVGELLKRSKLPGVGDAFALMNKMDGELKRAQAAKDSASLRNFYVMYRTAIGKLRQIILSTTADFVARVRKAEEDSETNQQKADEYFMLRLELDNTLEALDYQLKQSSPETIYRLLTEQWLRDSTVRLDGVGVKASYVFIRLEADYSVRDAHIFGVGGQKLAEQLLRDTPGGIDVYSMKVPRFVHYFKEGARGASTVLKVDERGFVDSRNSDGNYRKLHSVLEQQGLRPTTKITGE